MVVLQLSILFGAVLSGVVTSGFGNTNTSSGAANYTVTHQSLVTMPVYSIQDNITSGGWHEHHFCICGVSTQSGATQNITWSWTNSDGTSKTALAAGASGAVAGATAEAIGPAIVGDNTLAKIISNDITGFASQNNGSYVGAGASFTLNESGGNSSLYNYALVWFYLSENSSALAAGQAEKGAATANQSPISITFSPVGIRHMSLTSPNNSLVDGMGVCNSNSIFSRASDANQCGDHPVASFIIYVPSSHPGGLYRVYFKMTNELI